MLMTFSGATAFGRKGIYPGLLTVQLHVYAIGMGHGDIDQASVLENFCKSLESEPILVSDVFQRLAILIHEHGMIFVALLFLLSMLMMMMMMMLMMMVLALLILVPLMV